MELCSRGHPEVCYEEGNCPLCECREDLENQIATLQEGLAAVKWELEKCQEES